MLAQTRNCCSSLPVTCPRLQLCADSRFARNIYMQCKMSMQYTRMHTVAVPQDMSIDTHCNIITHSVHISPACMLNST